MAIDEKTGEAVSAPEQARLRNGLAGQAFAVCQRGKADVYTIMRRVIVKDTRRGGDV